MNDSEVWETGSKDAVVAFPGEIARVTALFPLERLFVWHCHTLEHEDIEMMRPYCVGNSATCRQHTTTAENLGFDHRGLSVTLVPTAALRDGHILRAHPSSRLKGDGSRCV